MNPTEFRGHIKRFVVDWPLKIFNPTFELMEYPGAKTYDPPVWNLVLILENCVPIDGPNVPAAKNFKLRLTRYIELEDFKIAYDVWDLLRMLLKEFVTHEVDESIKIKNIRLYDPHASYNFWRPTLEAKFQAEDEAVHDCTKIRKYHDFDDNGNPYHSEYGG